MKKTIGKTIVIFTIVMMIGVAFSTMAIAQGGETMDEPTGIVPSDGKTIEEATGFVSRGGVTVLIEDLPP